MNERRITIVRLGDDVEEEVVVEIAGQVVTCFLSFCPHAISAGNSYEGSLSLWAADGLDVREAADQPKGISRLGDGFRHRVVGILRGNVLEAGIRFEDESFSLEYQYLDGHSVAVEVDRIQLAIE